MAQSELPGPVTGSVATPTGAEQMDAPLLHEGDLPEAMWDTQFDYDVTSAAGAPGQAAALFVNGEFWTARWASDTLYRFEVDGTFIGYFVIPQGAGNLSGTRAMTTDGTHVYVANNTSTIYEVDTATRTITGSFSAPIGSVRFLTYDSLANNGNGGFWVGNFNTDITLMSRTGAALASIPAATHGLGGMYGAAVDNFSQGGPYLWVFHQSGGPSASTITQLKLPQGTPTGIFRDALTDFSSVGGLAGGCFIASGIVPGEATLGGLIQGNPNRLFGYQLDFQPIQNDIALASLGTPNGLTQVPERLVEPLSFEASYDNRGLNTADTVQLIFEVFKDGSLFFSDNRTFFNVGPEATGQVLLGPFTPDGEGRYDITALVRMPGATDEQPDNDSIGYTLTVTESTLARDDDVHNGGTGYVVSSQSTALAIVLHTFPVTAPLAGVEIEIESPQHGDTTYAVVVLTSGGLPFGGSVFSGTPVVLDSNIHDYFLPFPEVLFLPPGTFGLGVYEDEAGIFLRQSQRLYTPGVNYFSTDQSTWTASGIPTARFIRPRLADCAGFTLALSATPDNGTANGTATIAGTFGPVTVQWTDPGNQTTLEAIGLNTGTYTVTVTDSIGCTYTDSVEVLSNVGIGEHLAGIDRLEVAPNPSRDRFALHLDLHRAQAVELRLSGLAGQQLRTWSLPPTAQQRHSLDLGDLPAGVYLLHVKTATGMATRRLMKE